MKKMKLKSVGLGNLFLELLEISRKNFSQKYGINLRQTSFLVKSIETWDRIALEKKIKISIGEETITDINLQDLQLANWGEISTQKFNRSEESENGADWEWWFVSAGKSFGLRIQAKKLDINKGIYPKIDRHIGDDNTKPRQIDLLINCALKNKPKLLPIYVFYSYFENISEGFKNKCNLSDKLPDSSLGCTFLPAEILKNNYDLSKITPQLISDKVYPWHCLFCNYQSNDCREQPSSDPKEILPDKVFKSIAKKFEDLHLDDKKSDFVTEKIPNYVIQIMNGNPLEKKDLRKIKTKYVTVMWEK